MNLIWKNNLRNFLKNRIEFFSLFFIIVLVNIVIIGVSGAVSFLHYQKNTINLKGNAADAVVTVNTVGGDTFGPSDGTAFGRFVPDTTTTSASTKDEYSLRQKRADLAYAYITSFLKVAFENHVSAHVSNYDDRVLSYSIPSSNSDISKPKNSGTVKIISINGDITNSAHLTSGAFYKDMFKNIPPDKLDSFLTEFGKNYFKRKHDIKINTINKDNWWSNAWTGSSTGVLNKNSYFNNPSANPNITSGWLENFDNFYKNVDNPYCIKGSFPTDPTQIDISASFAVIHKLHIGDKMVINAVPYTICGFAVTPKYLYSQLSPLDLVPNNKNDALAFTMSSFYTDFFQKIFFAADFDRELSLDFKLVNFNGSPLSSKLKTTVLKEEKSFFGKYINSHSYLNTDDQTYGVSVDQRVSYKNVNDSSYMFYNRTQFINIMSEIILILGVAITFLISLTTIFSLIIIIKKQVSESSKQLGTMKSLGYTLKDIVLAYWLLPFIISVLGSITGLVISIFFWIVALYFFVLYLNLEVNNIWSLSNINKIFSLSYPYVIIGFICSTALTALVSWYVFYKNLKSNVVILLKDKE